VNLAGLASLPVRPLRAGVWYRAVPPGFAHAPIPPPGFTHTVTTRFNAGDAQAPEHRFDVLYLAEDILTCLYEFGALLGTPFRSGWSVRNPQRPVAVVRFRIARGSFVDLTDPAVAEPMLAASAQTLTGDWEGYRRRSSGSPVTLPTGIAPTQQLGRALYTLDIDGFIAVSARVPTRRVLVLFDLGVRGERVRELALEEEGEENLDAIFPSEREDREREEHARHG
jgi:hypothetical protein